MTNDSEQMPDEIWANIGDRSKTSGQWGVTEQSKFRKTQRKKYTRLPDGLTLEGLCEAVDGLASMIPYAALSEKYDKYSAQIAAARDYLQRRRG